MALSKPLGIVVIPNQTVPASFHAMSPREAHDFISLDEVVGALAQTHLPPLHCVLRFDHAEFTCQRFRVGGFGEQRRTNRSAHQHSGGLRRVAQNLRTGDEKNRGSKQEGHTAKADAERHGFRIRAPQNLTGATAGGGVVRAMAVLKFAVRSFPPLKFTISDCTVKIGPQGMPHQPITRVSRVHGSPLPTVLSPAGMKYASDDRRNVITKSETQ